MTIRVLREREKEIDPVWRLSIGFLEIIMPELCSEREVKISI